MKVSGTPALCTASKDDQERPSSALTAAEVLALPAVVDVPTAGRCLGIGRNKAYELAATGEWPVRVLRLGNALRVPTASILEALGMQEPPERQGGPASERDRQSVEVATNDTASIGRAVATVNRGGGR